MSNERRDRACEDYTGLLVRAAEGALGGHEQSRLDAHLAVCPQCVDALHSQRVAHEALTAWRPVQAPPDFVARVLGGLEERRSWLEGWDFRQWTWRLAPLASALAIAAVVVVGRPELGSAIVDDTTVLTADVDVTVATSLGSPELTQTDVLALLLTADADEPLVGALEELSQ